MHGPTAGHRSLPCTPQRTINAQTAGHASLYATPQRQNTAQHTALGSQRRLAFGSAPQDMGQGSALLACVGEASAETTHYSVQQLHAKFEEKERENRMLQAQLRMAIDKAQMDVMMLQQAHERKVGLLIDKLRQQRMCLEITKDAVAEIICDLPLLQSVCSELSHSLQSGDAASNFTSQRMYDLSQSLGDAGGVGSSQGSMRSAAGTVVCSEGAEAESHKLFFAQQKIRKLESELAVSQDRSKRIAGLEDEMEAYMSIQDHKIQSMQCQICDLMSKLEAERKRNEELCNKQSPRGPLVTVEKGDTSHIMQMKLSSAGQLAEAQDLNQDEGGPKQTVLRGASLIGDRSNASPMPLISSQRGCSPYNPIEFREWVKDKEEDLNVLSAQRSRRGSVSELANKFEFGRPPSGSDNQVSAAVFDVSEKEITSSPRLIKLSTSAQRSLVQKAISLYDSRGKQRGVSECKSKAFADVALMKSNFMPQSSHPAQPHRLGMQSNMGRAASLDCHALNSLGSSTDIGPSEESTKASGACAGNCTPVNTSTLDVWLAEYSGQQEEINPTYTASNSLNDLPHSSWVTGKMYNTSLHNARPMPRVLHVQGSSQNMPQLPDSGHSSLSKTGLPPQQAGLRYIGFKKSGEASNAFQDQEVNIRGLQA